MFAGGPHTLSNMNMHRVGVLLDTLHAEIIIPRSYKAAARDRRHCVAKGQSTHACLLP